MGAKNIFKKVMTISAAAILTAPIYCNNLTTNVRAVINTPANQDAKPAIGTAKQPGTSNTVNDANPAVSQTKKVKTFKVAIVKKNYGIYQGNFTNKKSSSKYFHQTFNVNK